MRDIIWAKENIVEMKMHDQMPSMASNKYDRLVRTTYSTCQCSFLILKKFCRFEEINSHLADF